LTLIHSRAQAPQALEFGNDPETRGKRSRCSFVETVLFGRLARIAA
jgi:hypothetical protein